MTLLVQISDLHFGTEQAPVVEALARFVDEQAPSVAIVSGDITQRARRAQFSAARAFIRRLDVPATLVIPGNHDIPLYNLAARAARPYAGFRRAFGSDLEPGFETDDVLVLTLNTTRAYLHEKGAVSPRQIERVARRLERAGGAQLRIVVTHQPVSVTRREDRADLLHGRARAVRSLAAAGADLILGGHIHLPFVQALHIAWPALPRAVWAVQAGTAVSSRVRDDAGNSVNLIRCAGPSVPRRCSVERWDYDAAQDRFALVARNDLVFDDAPADAPLVALAQALGAHALAGFFGLLGVLLVAVAMLGVSLRRFSRLRRRAEVHPYATLFVRLLLGFGLIAGAAFVFAEIAEEIGPGEELAHLDQVFSDAVIASTPESVRRMFAWVSQLGDPLTLVALGVAVVLVLMLRGERLLAVGFGVAMGGNALLNLSLKHVFERARPLHDAGPTPFAGYSFPSGHSSGALVAYGMLAYVLIRTLPRGWHLPAALLCTAAAFSVGASRIFVQAHFASDVAAGFASGGAWLTICILSVEWVQRERRTV